MPLVQLDYRLPTCRKWSWWCRHSIAPIRSLLRRRAFHPHDDGGIELSKPLRWRKRIATDSRRGETRYHTPFDDMYQPMNLEAARLHTRFLARNYAILASSDDEPQWHSNSRFRTVRLQTIAENDNLFGISTNFSKTHQWKLFKNVVDHCIVMFPPAAERVSTIAANYSHQKDRTRCCCSAKMGTGVHGRASGRFGLRERWRTATGIQALLIRGDVEISTASRPITFGSAAIGCGIPENGFVLVARDALERLFASRKPGFRSHPQTIERNFSGDIRNWREVGGNDAPIEVFADLKSSGTYAYFREHILKIAIIQPMRWCCKPPGKLSDHIRNHPNAIGYGGLGYGQDLRHCRVNSIPATHSSVQYDLYPISRYLYFYSGQTARRRYPSIYWLGAAKRVSKLLKNPDIFRCGKLIKPPERGERAAH